MLLFSLILKLWNEKMFELKGVAKFCDEVDENLMITFSPYEAHFNLHECYINPNGDDLSLYNVIAVNDENEFIWEVLEHNKEFQILKMTYPTDFQLVENFTFEYLPSFLEIEEKHKELEKTIYWCSRLEEFQKLLESKQKQSEI